MKVRGDFLGPPRSTDKTTLIIKVEQSVVSSIADTGTGPNTFVEVDHEIFSIVIFLFSVIQEGILSVTSESVCKKYCLV